MRKICIKIIGIILLIVIVTSTNISIAVTQSEIDSQKQKQQENIDKQQELQQKHNQIENQKSEVMKQVESLGSQIDSYESQINDLDSQIDDANNKIDNAEKELEENKAEYEKHEKAFKERMVVAYQYGETSYLDFLLSSSSLIDLISNYFLVSTLADIDQSMLDKLEEAQKKISNLLTEIETSKRELETAKAEKENVATQLKSAKAEKNKYVSELNAEEAELAKEIEELKQANARIASEIKAAEIKYAQQLEALRNNSSGNSSAPSAGGGYLSAPVSGTISARAYYSSGKFHGAIDYSVPVGTPVYAAADGVVMSTANLSGSYGTYVVIRHANGLQTYYAHGTYGSICVSPGEIVSRGEKIMLSGNTGNSTGPHMHFEVRVSPYNYSYYATAYGQDSRVNPASYM